MSEPSFQHQGELPGFESSAPKERPVTQVHHVPEPSSLKELSWLGLGALGVVYGDIGTSPLYAIRECFLTEHTHIHATQGNILGILSLVFWSLMVVVVAKYLTFVLRADNRGEGGVLALLALVAKKIPRSDDPFRAPMLLSLALFGTALLIADGMITPSISVLSAVEGVEIAFPQLHHLVIPITIGILGGLFLMQSRGTAKVANIFGPAMVVWFLFIGLLGLPEIVRNPSILWAVSPHHAINFFLQNGKAAFFVLGSVVLCITGTEALYADMGHFGRKPIKFAWYALVMPGLLINYFGQGALLLSKSGDPSQLKAVLEHPFYALAGGWLLYPTIAVATLATIIASQALISGMFSLSQQAVQLGYLPRLTIIHTSREMRGQIYIPEVNWFLMAACFALVLMFKSSSNLAAAYGISVVGAMSITSVLMYVLARKNWGWTRAKAGWLFGAFLAVDLIYLAANTPKLGSGGLFPLVVGAFAFFAMTTWKMGQAVIADKMRDSAKPLEDFMEQIRHEEPPRVKGYAVFMTSQLDMAPPVLLHHYKHNKVLHKSVILLKVQTENVPVVDLDDRITFKDDGLGFHQVTAKYGFMETPDVREILVSCNAVGLPVSLLDTSFYVGRMTVLATGESRLPRWRKWIYAVLSRNARPATGFFNIPPDMVIEVGMEIEV
ncbi:MAG: Low affinity potassium transport system protein kup [Myxococcota bacterium]|nr:Low affinity potassium transport system protein kup [Myxococcota bacterium]